jgi:hypothetical protein
MIENYGVHLVFLWSLEVELGRGELLHKNIDQHEKAQVILQEEQAQHAGSLRRGDHGALRSLWILVIGSSLTCARAL